jgi:uncharacterized repeat protein (TIGR03943 family)
VNLDLRAFRLLVLVAWTAFFAWLWGSGEVVRYLGPRTEWVVPAGTIGLVLATAGYAYATRGGADSERPPRREVLGALALLLPIVTAALVANASLGSLAASKKLTARGVDVTALARLDSDKARPVSFLDLSAAGEDASFAREQNIRPGRPVELVGFVSKGASARRPFELSRFYITCCVADALPVGVTVVPGVVRQASAERKDQWLAVTGTVVRRGRGYAVRAESIRKVTQPKDPYLSFAS